MSVFGDSEEGDTRRCLPQEWPWGRYLRLPPEIAVHRNPPKVMFAIKVLDGSREGVADLFVNSGS